MSNKRRYERLNLALEVSIKEKGGLVPLQTGNISKYGLFLISDTPKAARQLVKLVITFPHTGHSFDVLAQVMWSDPTGESGRGEGFPGMGVKFFSIPEGSKKQWETFVELARAGKLDPEILKKAQEALPKKTKKKEEKGVHSIGEEELEELSLEGLESLDELDELDLSEIEGLEDDGEIDPEMDAAIQDLSAALEEYESGDADVEFTLEPVDETTDEPIAETVAQKEETPPASSKKPQKKAAPKLEPKPEAEPKSNAEPKPDESEESGKERREYPRKDVAFKVKVGDIDSMREFFTRDISLGGMYIHSKKEWKVGDKIGIFLVHPWTYIEYPLKASVKRLGIDASGVNEGIGIEFSGMNDDHRDELLTFIESGYYIKKEGKAPLESVIIRRIEDVNEMIKDNPVDAALHFEAGLLHQYLSNWKKAEDHLKVADKLGYELPSDLKAMLEEE